MDMLPSVVSEEFKEKLPQLIKKYEKCFENSLSCDNCFLKGCKWSPDGKCLLAASDDFHLRLFEILEETSTSVEDGGKPILDYNEGGTIYDYAWYPRMSSGDPVSCVFASTSRSSPIHLWDAFTGALRATYQPINQYDEVHAAYSVCFSPDGKLFCGFKKAIKVFNLGIPGREFEEIPLKGLQRGIISCIAFNPSVTSLFAVGSYDKSIGLYSTDESNCGSPHCLLVDQEGGGITHLQFSPDGKRLYCGSRQYSEILCWDLRNPGSVMFAIKREVNSCQRIYFDLTSQGRFLFTGSSSGVVTVYDTNLTPLDLGHLSPVISWQAHMDCTNGVSVHPNAPKLATASGQRHLAFSVLDDEDDAANEDIIENSLKVWNILSL